MGDHEFELVVVGQSEWNTLDDNVDIEVKLSDGSWYTATVFTMNNLKSLFDKNKATGECAGGLYLWAAEMIIVEKLTFDVLNSMIVSLLEQDEFQSAFTRVPDTTELI